MAKAEMEQASGQQLRQKKGWKRARRRGKSRRRSSAIVDFYTIFFYILFLGRLSLRIVSHNCSLVASLLSRFLEVNSSRRRKKWAEVAAVHLQR